MIDRRQEPPQERRDRRQSERRESERADTETGIRMMHAGDGSPSIVAGDLIEVSMTGLRIEFDEPLAEGESVLIEVRTPARCFNLNATVVWVKTTESGRFRVGCELRIDLTRRQFESLQALVNESAAS